MASDHPKPYSQCGPRSHKRSVPVHDKGQVSLLIPAAAYPKPQQASSSWWLYPLYYNSQLRVWRRLQGQEIRHHQFLQLPLTDEPSRQLCQTLFAHLHASHLALARQTGQWLVYPQLLLPSKAPGWFCHTLSSARHHQSDSHKGSQPG